MVNGWHSSKKLRTFLWIVGLLTSLCSGLAGCASGLASQAGEANFSDGSPTRGGDTKSDLHGMFDGDWGYAKQCDSGHFISLVFKQDGSKVSGRWDAGTHIRGSGGLLDGMVRGNRLFVRYCSEDGEKGYPACPEYEDETDYFVRQGDDLVRYQKYGDDYQEDVVLHRDIPGREVPIDTTYCEEDAEDEGAP